VYRISVDFGLNVLLEVFVKARKAARKGSISTLPRISPANIHAAP
jgi:hypothetical protein